MTATIDDPTTPTVTPDAAQAPDAEATSLRMAREGKPAEVRLLGYEVNWSVQGILVDRETLKILMAEAGLAAYFPQRPPTAKRALRRAIVEWGSARAGVAFADDEDAGEISRRRKLIREIRSKAERGQAAPITYALVEEASLGAQLGLKYATNYRFQYQPSAPDEVGTNDGTLRVSTTGLGRFDLGLYEETRRVEAEVAPLWAKHKTLYAGSDLSPLLIAMVHGARGIAVQAGTGVWFVPEAAAGFIDRLERLIAALAAASAGGRDPYVRVRENIDWPRTRRALADAAQDAILAEIEAAAGRLDRFEEQDAAKPGSVRVATMAGLMSEFVALQQKAAYYAQTVGMRTPRVNAGLVAISDRAVAVARNTRAARGGGAPVAPALAVPDSARQSRLTRG